MYLIGIYPEKMLVKGSDIAGFESCSENIYVVKLKPRSGMWHPVEIPIDSTFPLDFADLKGSPESIFSWLEKYDVVPDNKNLDTLTPKGKLKNRRVFFDIQIIDYYQREWQKIGIALALWKNIASKNLDYLNKNLSYSEKLGPLWTGEAPYLTKKPPYALSLSYGSTPKLFRDKRYPSDNGRIIFDSEVDSILITACLGLQAVINDRLGEMGNFPQVDFVLDEEAKPTKKLTFKAAEAINDALGFAWDVIREGISGTGVNKWPYARCASCGKWLFISQPGRKRLRCELCAVRYNRLSNKLLKREQRGSGSHGEEIKRGRPPKKN